MSKIIGTRQVSFTGKDGSPVSGTKIYITEPIQSDNGTGVSADSIFLSSQRLSTLDFVPAVGLEIEVFYDKGGRIKKISQIKNDAFMSDDFDDDEVIKSI